MDFVIRLPFTTSAILSWQVKPALSPLICGEGQLSCTNLAFGLLRSYTCFHASRAFVMPSASEGPPGGGGGGGLVSAFTVMVTERAIGRPAGSRRNQSVVFRPLRIESTLPASRDLADLRGDRNTRRMLRLPYELGLLSWLYRIWHHFEGGDGGWSRWGRWWGDAPRPPLPSYGRPSLLVHSPSRKSAGKSLITR